MAIPPPREITLDLVRRWRPCQPRHLALFRATWGEDPVALTRANLAAAAAAGQDIPLFAQVILDREDLVRWRSLVRATRKRWRDGQEWPGRSTWEKLAPRERQALQSRLQAMWASTLADVLGLE